jgi:glutamate racemase
MLPSSATVQPVLVFDSGVGGLTILEALRERLPGERFAYACDNAAFPYGPKPEVELVERVHALLDALIDRFAPKLVVVACNTASTVALPRLRSHYALPIVGVVPAIKPAAQLSRNRIIGLLATPGTVQRPYTEQLIRDFAADCTVIRVGSSELVVQAERKLRGEAVDQVLVRELLQPFVTGGADTVVLGCTHFPLLRDELQRAVGKPLQWIDSGDAIARRVEQLLTERLLHREAQASAPIDTPVPAPIAVLSRNDSDARALWPALQQRGFGTLEIVDV